MNGNSSLVTGITGRSMTLNSMSNRNYSFQKPLGASQSFLLYPGYDMFRGGQVCHGAKCLNTKQ